MKPLRLSFISIIIFSFIFCNTVPGQNIVINEVMSGNTSIIEDEDKDYSDWIELYNNNSERTILSGYYLSDKKDSLKWKLPSITLEPHEYLILFASGKNRNEYTTWRTVIDWGNSWKYFVGISEPDSNWKSVEFNESSWQEGPSGIGFGNKNDATEIPITRSLYVRKKFKIDDVNSIEDIKLIMDYDDGYAAYMNGEEVARENIPGKPGEKIPFDKAAYWRRDGMLSKGLVPAVKPLKKYMPNLTNGENVIAIQVHNSLTKLDTDLTCIPVLFLKYKNQETAQGSHVKSPFMDSIITECLHTNFKLSSSGEKLYLYDSDKNIIDYINIPSLGMDNSYGRLPDGSNNLFIMTQPSPGYKNNASNKINSYIEEPAFSIPAGFYQDSIVVNLLNKNPDVKIYYTLDSSEPSDTSATSILYTEPIHINKTQVIRARAFTFNGYSKNSVTNTYLINENTALPVISLSSDPKNLWDSKTGILAGNNIWQDWEKPIHIEFFERDRSLAFDLNAGVKVTGNGSRELYPQKSLVLFARDKYDDKQIDYQIFPDKPIKHFEAIVLRNGGNDWNKTLFRDGFMQELSKGTNIDLQAYRPAVTFLNGIYYGMYGVRERLNEDYVAGNYNIDRDSIYIIKPEYQSGFLYEGRENQAYSDLQDYVYAHDLRISEYYNYVVSEIDVNNFIDYNAAEVYYNNYDWPILNQRMWRLINGNGRWRWILCDTDFGYGYGFFPYKC